MITPQGGWDGREQTSEPDSKPLGGMAEGLPRVAYAASIVAFVLAAIAVLYALLQGHLAGLLSASIYLVGGIGIARRRVWSAYGLALVEATGLVDGLIILLAWRVATVTLFPSSVINLVLMILFFLSGRSLAAAGAPKGRAAPWIAFAVLLIAFAVPFVWLQPFSIPSGAMENTLLVGDSVLVKLRPNSAPVRGDIIVFRYPLDIKQTFVKRVIGLPGDRIHLENRQLFLNGHKLDEPYVAYKAPPSPYADNFPRAPESYSVYPPAEKMLHENVQDGEVVVPPGHYFAMGDNRDNSSDSRYWGFVPRENIIGKPLIIYWSYEATTDDLTDPGVGISHLIDMLIHFPTKTRWSREFRLIHPYPIS